MEDCPSNQNGEKGRYGHGEGRFEDGKTGVKMGSRYGHGEGRLTPCYK